MRRAWRHCWGMGKNWQSVIIVQLEHIYQRLRLLTFDPTDWEYFVSLSQSLPYITFNQYSNHGLYSHVSMGAFMLQNCVNRIICVPDHVLLDEDKVQAVQYSDEEFRKKQEKLENLQRRLKKVLIHIIKIHFFH